MLIDTHAHLFWDSYKDDFDDVIQRSLDNGVTTVINVGTDLDTSKRAVGLKSDKIQFFSTIGIHPHEISKYLPDNTVSIQKDMEQLGIIYQENKSNCIAIGECGLDYAFENNPDYTHSTPNQSKNLQKKLFLAHINLSKKLDLPLIIHCRDAWNDIFGNLENIQGVFHTFTGTEKDAKIALDLGFYLSFSCILTYPKNEYLRDIVKNTPLDRILTETDSPFLPPQSKRGKRNEPQNIKEVIQLISDLKGMPFEQTANQIYQNTKQLFKIPLDSK